MLPPPPHKPLTSSLTVWLYSHHNKLDENLFQSSIACSSDSHSVWHVGPYFVSVLGSLTRLCPGSSPASLWLPPVLRRLLLPLRLTWEKVLFQPSLLCFIDSCISAATALLGEGAPPSESPSLPRSYVWPWGTNGGLDWSGNVALGTLCRQVIRLPVALSFPWQ